MAMGNNPVCKRITPSKEEPDVKWYSTHNLLVLSGQPGNCTPYYFYGHYCLGIFKMQFVFPKSISKKFARSPSPVDKTVD